MFDLVRKLFLLLPGSQEMADNKKSEFEEIIKNYDSLQI